MIYSKNTIKKLCLIFFICFLGACLQLQGQVAPKAVDLASGYYHSVALMKDGSVFTWGNNRYGQLGDGSFKYSNRPVEVSSLQNVIQISSKGHHVLALKSDKTVWAWGHNFSGELGNGTNRRSSVPTQVLTAPGIPLTGVVRVAAGRYHSLALRNDGTVWVWGCNLLGQLGTGDLQNSNLAVRIPDLTNVKSITAGAYHSAAYTNNGLFFSWGYNKYGQLGNGSTANSSVPKSIEFPGEAVLKTWDAGQFHTLVAIDVPVESLLAKKTKIKKGKQKLLPALDSVSTILYAWGSNQSGQLGNGTTENSLIPIQVTGDWERLDRVAAGAAFHSIAILDASRELEKQENKILSLNNSLAIQNSNFLNWGYNKFGQLGNGSTTDSTVPLNPLAPFTAVSGAGGAFHTLAIDTNGDIWAWGSNRSGQLGNGTNIHSSIPIKISFNPVVTATPSQQTICSGGKTSIALHSNFSNTTFSWTVKENNVSGASNGTGNVIAQTLMASSCMGTVTYTITPFLNGFMGVPIDVIVTVTQCVSAPKNFQGLIKKNQFASQTDIIHLLFWTPSVDPLVIGYQIFEGNKLIKTLSKEVSQLKLHQRKKNKIYNYTLVAFTSDGITSMPLELKL